MQIVQELGLAETLSEIAGSIPQCTHTRPKVRSKAVSVLGDVPAIATEVILDKVLNDSDARARQRDRSAGNTSGPGICPAAGRRCARSTAQYVARRRKCDQSDGEDESGDRVESVARHASGSAAPSTNQCDVGLRQIGWWNLLNEVGRIAKSDPDQKARRYAMAVLPRSPMRSHRRKSRRRRRFFQPSWRGER